MDANMSDLKVGLIATMPRSGTWYNFYFFYFYDHLLRVLRSEGNIPQEVSDDVSQVILNRKDTIGLDVMLISHSICPGFECYQGKYRESWDQLTFYAPGFDLPFPVQNKTFTSKRLVDPTRNRNVRIAYFYRNPLDQAVSFFRHVQNHINQLYRYREDSQGNLVLMTSVREYIHYVGLDAYIKQFLTFKIMKDLYPDNILLSTYENLVREPQTTFLSVLNHFGHDIEPRLHLVVVEMALSLSNRKSIMQIENLMGRSLANDQQELSERHIRSGTVGGWKAHFNDADLAKIEQRLEQFGLSLADFEIE